VASSAGVAAAATGIADWAGFGTELDVMRGLLEDMSRQTGGH
jgi:hypothetical protein